MIRDHPERRGLEMRKGPFQSLEDEYSGLFREQQEGRWGWSTKKRREMSSEESGVRMDQI